MNASSNTNTTLLAVRVSGEDIRLDPAPASREWMAATPDGFARRCQPMVLANQHGWWLTNQVEVKAVWSGDNEPEGTKVETTSTSVSSHFGSGIVTWSLPFLFRTPIGAELLLRGPANFPLDGATPLEGLIETDWSPATATMNWKLTRPGLKVVFPVDAPIGMIVPVERGYLESFRPAVALLAEQPAIESEYDQWRRSRQDFLDVTDRTDRPRRWQGDYFRGRVGTAVGGRRSHRSRILLEPFETTL